MRLFSTYCIAVLLCCACLLSSCGKPDLLVPGLTLPQGSKVVNYAKSDAPGGEVTVVGVFFNCSAGWDAVSSHIDDCMLKAGIAETTSEDKIGLGDREIEEIQRTYGKPGDRYGVTISNSAQLMSSDGSADHSSWEWTGSYMLNIYEYHQ